MLIVAVACLQMSCSAGEKQNNWKRKKPDHIKPWSYVMFSVITDVLTDSFQQIG